MEPTQPVSVLISKPYPLTHRRIAAGVLLLVAMSCVFFLPADWAWAEEAASADQGSDETRMQVAAWAVTVPYIIAKGAFALGGAIVGALGYVFSGLSYNTANAVWAPSITGTYIIRPAHLRGEEPVRFVGDVHEPHDESLPPPSQSTTEK